MATTSLYNHILILLKNHIWTLVKIKNRYSTQFRRGTIGLRHPAKGVHQVNKGLYDGVVGGVHVGVEGEGALAVAVEGGVSLRGDDPVFPTKVSADCYKIGIFFFKKDLNIKILIKYIN